MQEKLLSNSKIDALIILDACRYDIFSDVVYDYLDGSLVAALSPASTTPDWLKHMVSKFNWRSYVAVTASPMINKRGVYTGLDLSNKFMYIEEVWDWGWDENISTTPPEKVNLAVKITMTKLKLKKLRYPHDYKLLVWYAQPHAPYVLMVNIISRIMKLEELSNRIIDKNIRKLKKVVGKFSIDHILLGTLKDVLKDVEKVNRVLRKAYIENLKWILRSVADLITMINGNIVITSDHGELLGEHGLYFHPNLPLPLLRLVPWFIVR